MRYYFSEESRGWHEKYGTSRTGYDTSALLPEESLAVDRIIAYASIRLVEVIIELSLHLHRLMLWHASHDQQ
jgi:hypothetical protein